MKYNSEMFINYKPNKDWIARATDVGWFGTEILRTARKNMENLGYSKLTGEGYDTLIRLEGNSHDLSSWQFDEQGRILIADTEKNQNKRLKQRQQAIAVNYRKSVAFLIRLKRKFQTKGPITPNEQIYLDDSKALAFVEKVATEYKMNCQDVIQSLRQSIDDIEQPWVDIQTEAFRVGTLLTQSEVYEAMESVGVTKQSVVLEPLEEYTDMLNEWLEKEKDFDALIEKIKTSIAKLVELDEDLARQISS